MQPAFIMHGAFQGFSESITTISQITLHLELAGAGQRFWEVNNGPRPDLASRGRFGSGLDGLNEPWHYTNFVLATLKNGYGGFEHPLGVAASPRGAKSALVEAAVQAKTGNFTLAALERECPGVSRDLIRRILGICGRRAR